MTKKIALFLDRLSLFCICGAIFFVLFSSHVQKIFLYISIGALLIRKVLEYRLKIRPLFKKTYLDLAVLLFPVAVFLAILFSKNFYESQKVFFDRIVIYAAIFLVIKETIYSKKRAYAILGVLVAVSCIAGIDAIWQYFRGFDFFFHFPKDSLGVKEAVALTGPFAKYNSFSGFLEITVPLMVFLCFMKKNKLVFGLIYLTTAMLLFSWIFDFSRGTWLCVILSCLFVSFFLKKRYTLIFLLVLALIAIFFMPREGYARIYKTFHGQMDSGRFKLWEEGVGMVKKNPLLVGGGLGSYGANATTGHLHAHNTYLELLVDTGLLGLLSFLYLLAIFLKNAFSSLIIEKQKQKRVILSALLASCVSSFLAAFVSTNMLVGIRYAALFWIILSLGVVLPGLDFD